jgi:hypothetical protein
LGEGSLDAHAFDEKVVLLILLDGIPGCKAMKVIFEERRAQATSSKFQTPSSKEAPSSKLKNRPARRLPRHLFLGFGV